jgi:hypothetical protein
LSHTQLLVELNYSLDTQRLTAHISAVHCKEPNYPIIARESTPIRVYIYSCYPENNPHMLAQKAKNARKAENNLEIMKCRLTTIYSMPEGPVRFQRKALLYGLFSSVSVYRTYWTHRHLLTVSVDFRCCMTHLYLILNTDSVKQCSGVAVKLKHSDTIQNLTTWATSHELNSVRCSF